MISNPYVVGQWVRGDKFYGRTALIDEILHGHRNWLWLLGTRRIGKTSLLKQVEHIAAADPELDYFPLFWDFQGSHTPEELNLGFGDSLDSLLERQWAGDDEPVVLVLHLACPRVEYTDRGKSAVVVH